MANNGTRPGFRLRRRLAGGASVALLAVCLPGGGQAQVPAEARTVLEGVYTDAQAAQGQAVYDAACSRCHGETLDGGGQAPSLHADRFMDAWREDTLTGLFVHMQTRMPLPPAGKPGSLSEDEYLSILAYLLWMNELPSGAQPLTRAALETTWLVGLDGPRPLPATALIRVVGCLAAAEPEWTLTQAGALKRIRDVVIPDADTLAAAGQESPGTGRIRLTTRDDAVRASATAQAGTRVQVQGVLTGRGEAARLSILDLQPLTQACTP